LEHIGDKDFLCSIDNLIKIDIATFEKVMHGKVLWMWKWEGKQVYIPRIYIGLKIYEIGGLHC